MKTKHKPGVEMPIIWGMPLNSLRTFKSMVVFKLPEGKMLSGSWPSS